LAFSSAIRFSAISTQRSITPNRCAAACVFSNVASFAVAETGASDAFEVRPAFFTDDLFERGHFGLRSRERSIRQVQTRLAAVARVRAFLDRVAFGVAID
jgi:hypothetical protein